MRSRRGPAWRRRHWPGCVHHSRSGSATAGDAVILGASTLEQLAANLDACRSRSRWTTPLVEAFDAAWETCRPDCPPYFRT